MLNNTQGIVLVDNNLLQTPFGRVMFFACLFCTVFICPVYTLSKSKKKHNRKIYAYNFNKGINSNKKESENNIELIKVCSNKSINSIKYDSRSKVIVNKRNSISSLNVL